MILCSSDAATKSDLAAAYRHAVDRFAIRVRMHFLMKGGSYRAWSQAHGFYPGTVCRAIHGRHAGKLSRRILAELRKELGR